MQIRSLLSSVLCLLIISPSFWTQATGDTITVQTLTFADITKRRGWYIFPNDTNQYHKILMYYTLKCDQATTQDNYPCGEWDYTTYTRLFQHENINSPYYYLGNTTPNDISYLNQPKFDIYQHYDYHTVVTSTINEDSCILGNGALLTDEVFNDLTKSGRAQYLITKNELINQGIYAGDLNKLKLNFTNSGVETQKLVIHLKQTSLSLLSDSVFENNSLVKVYEKNTPELLSGSKNFHFLQPFVWNGTDNIIVDIQYLTSSHSSAPAVISDSAFNNAGLFQFHNGHFDFNDDDIVDIPASAFNNINSEITISFWCYGDENRMPFNSYIFEGRDQNGYRVVNCHLPWSNSNIYWDAGNSGTGSYDRVNQSANFNDFAGKWNHWAFTKDANTGEMIAYLNGEVFMSASGKTKTMSGITKFRIGGTAGANFNGVYDGKIDEFRVWNVALDQLTIKNWMDKTIQSTHPFYQNLQVAYDFNDIQNHQCTDYSQNQHHGTLLGLPELHTTNPNELNFNTTSTSVRPQMGFFQGSYTYFIDSTLYNDTIIGPSLSVIKTQPYVDMAVSGISKTIIDTTYAYESGWGFVYDPNGIKLDSVDFGEDVILNNNYRQHIHQLQNYVTPYGIGLDLGPQGFRWVYDVTDYTPLFKDTLEIRAGNQQELIDLKFVMIKGVPARDIIDFETIWRGDYGHANIANDISLPPVDIPLNPSASHYKIKTRTTGHWFGGFQNCAEFCPKLHHVKINGIKEFEWLNWKECADNPVISQGGTWIYDRAGWCPATFGTTYDHEFSDLVNPGDTVNVDYGMEVTAGGMEGNYRLTVQLVSYGDHNFQQDASIEDVLKPNNWEYHNRFNPMCDQPEIVVKNNGEQPIDNIKFEYWICGGPHEFHTWSGSLNFDESTSVTLPITDQSFWDHAQFCKKFHVVITEVNGTSDDYEENNFYTTSFEAPPVYQEDIVLWTRTNNAGNETKLYVKDVDGNDIFSRVNFQNNTLYKDTLNLTTGCYKIELIDTDHDGLNFFANNDGTGFFQIRKPSGAPLEGFDSDFGDQITHYFTVGYALSDGLESNFIKLNCHPNPATDYLNIELEGFVGKVTIEIFNAFGKKVGNDELIAAITNQKYIMEISSYETGLYLLKVTDDYHTKTMKFFHQ